MGFFSKLWKGPEVDLEKSGENAKKMRQMFDRVVENGGEYRLISGYTEDVSRFNYGFVHGSRRKVGSLIVGWNEESQTIVVVPTVPDLSGCLRLAGRRVTVHLCIPGGRTGGLHQVLPGALRKKIRPAGAGEHPGKRKSAGEGDFVCAFMAGMVKVIFPG